MIKNQFQTSIQILSLGSYLSTEGIIHQSSYVDTPQQNGIVERKNRHLLDIARSLLLSSNVPKRFWGEVVLTTTYLINRLPFKVLDFSTPHQVFLQHFPQSRLISSLPSKIFGCTMFVHIHQQHWTKLDSWSSKCIFLGYSPNQKGYKYFCPNNQRFYHTMDVTFFETKPYYLKTDIQGESSS